jgi:hypothetical protein
MFAKPFGTVPGLFRTVQVNCSLLMFRFIKSSFYGCSPQVVLAVPQVEKLQVAMSPPVLLETRTLVGVGLKAVLESQVTPIWSFPVMVERDRDFGVVEFWMRIPPKTTVPRFGPLLLMLASLISKPTPSRRMPPAVLLLTLTWSR